MSASFSPGVIIVPNEVFTADGATISAADGSFLFRGITLGDCECGSVLSNGVFCVGDTTGSGTHITSIPIYNPSLSVRGTAIPFTPSGFWQKRCGVTSDDVSTFYASSNDATFTALVRSFSDTGTTGGTTWHLDSGGGGGPVSLALSEDGSQFFYAKYASDAAPIKKWNLGSDTTGGTLVAGVAGTSFGQDLLRLPGTNHLIVIATTAGPVFTVRKYDGTSGTLLMSYALTGVTHEASPQRLSIDLGSDGSFWVRTFNDISSATTKFWQFNSSTGSLTASFTINTSSNVGSGKVPFSCPFFAWSLGSGSPTPTFVGTEQTLELVRVRQVGLPALPGNVSQFIGRSEVQMQPGLGVPADPTVAPTISMAWSGDNAMTFGQEKALSLGRTGAYYTRAYQHTVGSKRQPAVRVSCSDDVTFVPTDLFVTREEGTG